MIWFINLVDIEEKLLGLIMNSWWNTGFVGSEVIELRLDEREF